MPLDEKCPQCGNNLVLKHGRFGEFTACSNYPKCKYVKQKTIGVKCPECSGGEIIERRSKRGQDVLRLQPLSGLRLRRVGQADTGAVPGVRQPLPGREVAEGRPGCAVSERRVQVQAGSAKTCARRSVSGIARIIASRQPTSDHRLRELPR